MSIKNTWTFTITVLLAFALVCGGLAGVLLGEGLYFGRRLALLASESVFTEMAGHVEGHVRNLESRAEDLISIVEKVDAIRVLPSSGTESPALKVFTGALSNSESFYGLYVGHEDGSFYEVINLTSTELAEQIGAPGDARWASMTVREDVPGKRLQTWRFYDEKLAPLGLLTKPTDYDPRERPWYQSARESDRIRKVGPYVFSNLKKPGLSFVKSIEGTAKVVAIDITLSALSEFLASQKYTENTLVYTFKVSGGMIAFPDENRIVKPSGGNEGATPGLKMAHIDEIGIPAADQVLEIAREGEASQTRTLVEGNSTFLGLIAPLSENRREYMAIVAPLDELLGPYWRFGTLALASAAIVMCLFAVIISVGASGIARPIRRLAGEVEKIRTLRFGSAEPVDSRITEIQALSDTFVSMDKSIGDYRDSLLDTQKDLRDLIETGISLSAEKESRRLMEMILRKAMSFTRADAATLYTLDQNDSLEFAIVYNDTLGLPRGGKADNPFEFGAVPLRDPVSGEENHRNVVSHAVLIGKSVNIPDAHSVEEFDFSGMREFDEQTGYRSRSFLTVPLIPLGSKAIGALQLINAIDPVAGGIVAFSREHQELTEAMAAQAAVALDNQNLMEAQERLLDSIIKLVAGAIDAKSPYTGGHCQRVPVLATMLAEAATESRDGPFKDFALSDDVERREFEVAAWLHDCGKVTTPEYVVDKATKLETIYNRIHEIRMRFEVLLRDAEIDYYRVLANGGDPDQSRLDLDRRRSELTADFAFVAECNVGGEFMSDADIERLRTIARQTWKRHFDDRLGLSRDEMKRKAEIAPEAVPVDEPLLADKPEHRISRKGNGNAFADPELRFDINVPEQLYDFGELHNLTIRRGTLTDEERFKINEHIIQTIRMLESLPFPPRLKRVPEYAGAHHETMIGTGYPRKLSKDDMSIPARIMAIADIFEALTASDRPYKKAKTLTEALRIMEFMRKDRHIDSDLYDLFLRSGIHRRYAEQFLTPEQFDIDVDSAAEGAAS